MAGCALGRCVLLFAILELVASSTVRQYCIIGAGPAGELGIHQRDKLHCRLWVEHAS